MMIWTLARLCHPSYIVHELSRMTDEPLPNLVNCIVNCFLSFQLEVRRDHFYVPHFTMCSRTFLQYTFILIAVGAISLVTSHKHKFADLADLSYDLATCERAKRDAGECEDYTASDFTSLSDDEDEDEDEDFLIRTGLNSSDPAKAVLFNASACDQFPPSLFAEIQSYASIVDQIISAAMTGAYAGMTYNNLSYFVDTYDNRLSGSDGLESSIDFLMDQMRSFGFENVRTEAVPDMPAWKRGSESARMLTPKRKDIAIIGLGSSAPTLIFGIEAEAIVFDSYVELVANQSNVRNKIVVCNFGGPEATPLDTIDNGYVEAVTNGAVALLYKSAGTFSLYSPHARRGNLYYVHGVEQVPIAYITEEDTNLMSRISARGQTITLHINMQNENGTRTSRNLFGDLTGRLNPEEFILWSAHTDSWDVGQGAQDDGFGLYLALQGTSLLKSLDLSPRRTIRTAFWTSEEYGYLGSEHYIKEHLSEFSNLQVALEADYGCLASLGLIFNGRYELGCILHEILKLVESKTTLGYLVQANIYRTDLDNFEDSGVPVVSLYGDDGRYFYFHHTYADTMTAVNSETLDKCLATWTATAYILADLTNGVPQGFDDF